MSSPESNGALWALPGGDFRCPVRSHILPPRVSPALGGLCAHLPPHGWKCLQWGDPGLDPAFQGPGAGHTQPHVLTDLTSHRSPLAHSQGEGAGTKHESELPAPGGSPEDRPVAGQFWEGCGSALQAREGGDGGRRVAVPGPWALLLLCHPGSRQFLCQSSPTRPASTSSSRGWAGSQRHAHTLPPSGVLASWMPPQPTGDPSPT